MKKNMNKKILLSLGTLSAIATPIIAVVSCGSSSDKDKKDVVTLSASQQKIKDLLNPIFGVVMDSLDDAGKNKTTMAVETLLRGGIGKVTQDQVEGLLGVFGIDKSKLKPFAGLLFTDGKVNSKLLDGILNKGLKTVLNDKATKDKLMNALTSMLPESVSGFITPELVDVLLNGTTKVKFNKMAQDLAANLSGTMKDAASQLLPILYDGLPLFQKGILNSTLADWKKTIAAISGPAMAGVVIPRLPLGVDSKLPEAWQTGGKISRLMTMLNGLIYNMDSGKYHTTLDNLISIIPTLITKGLGKITSSQGQEIANVLDWWNQYIPHISKDSIENLKTELKSLLSDYFVDAKNTKKVDTSSIDAAKSIEQILSAAKSIVLYGDKIVAKAGTVATGVTGSSIYGEISDKVEAKSRIIDKTHNTVAIEIDVLEGFINQVKDLFRPSTPEHKTGYDKYIDSTTKKGFDISKLDDILTSAKPTAQDLTDSKADNIKSVALDKKLYEAFDEVIKTAKTWMTTALDADNNNAPVASGMIDSFLEKNDYFNDIIKNVKESVKMYSLTNDNSKNDFLDIDLSGVKNIADIISKLDALVNGKTALFKGKINPVDGKKINKDSKIDEKGPETLKSQTFGPNALPEFKTIVKTWLKENIKIKINNKISDMPEAYFQKITDVKLNSGTIGDAINKVIQQAQTILMGLINGGLSFSEDGNQIQQSDLQGILPMWFLGHIDNLNWSKPLSKEILKGDLSADASMLPKIINEVIKNLPIISKVLMGGLLNQTKEDQDLFIKTVSDLAFNNVAKLKNLGGKEVVKNLLDSVLKVMTDAKASKK